MKSWRLGYFIGNFIVFNVALLHSNVALAQGATKVIEVKPDNAAVFVSVGDYYSQVKFDVSRFEVPNDDNGRKQWGSAILAAFGLGNKTRSLTLMAILTQGGQALPPIPLITYSFDGKKRLTNFQRTSAYLSPRWQLAASDPISVTLKYQYSESVTYDPAAITNQVAELIPSNAIVTTLGKPFVTSIAALTTAVFENSGSTAVNVTNAGDFLLPYSGGLGARGITYSVKLPDGRPMGDIKATLMVSPSLLRVLTEVSNASAADLKRGSDNVGAIRMEIGGARKNVLQEIKGTTEYAAMTRTPSPATVNTYCNAALKTLGDLELTRLDRTTLVYQSLIDAGFNPTVYHPAANNWLASCYTAQSDIEGITTALDVSFTPPPQPTLPTIDPDAWPRLLKDAMGCWITNQSGEYCRLKAPNPQDVLESAMTPTVYVGVVELPTIDDSNLPNGRNLPKADLLALLNGKADTFSCFPQGLIITRDAQAYKFQVTLNKETINSIQVVRVSAEEAKCLGR